MSTGDLLFKGFVRFKQVREYRNHRGEFFFASDETVVFDKYGLVWKKQGTRVADPGPEYEEIQPVNLDNPLAA